MRISDWSSDVCSSDLRAHPGKRGKRQHHAVRRGNRPHRRRVPTRRPTTLPAHDLADPTTDNNAKPPPTPEPRRLQPLRGHDHSSTRSEEHTSEIQSLMLI